MAHSISSVIIRPRNGLLDEIERTHSDDEERGYERDETDAAYRRLTAWKAHRAQQADQVHRLNTLLLRLVAEGDARIAARADAARGGEQTSRTGCAA
ncbi:hypothetical protein [Streptomyces sp. NPDC015125]|uniref:hypothetical protein n=1 Tax=Streptomyces sp. NPDC015125 TaxID=3364938 RepID=UPI0036F6F178